MNRIDHGCSVIISLETQIFLCGCSLTYKTHSDKVKPLIPTALSTWLLFGHVLFSSISWGCRTFWGQVDALSPCLSLSSGCAREVLVVWQHKMSCSGTNVFGVRLIWRVVGPMVCINTSTQMTRLPHSTAQYCTVVKWTVLSGWRSNENNVCIKNIDSHCKQLVSLFWEALA